MKSRQTVRSPTPGHRCTDGPRSMQRRLSFFLRKECQKLHFFKHGVCTCLLGLSHNMATYLSALTFGYLDLRLWIFTTTYCLQFFLYCSAVQVGRSRVRFPMVSLEFFWHNPSGRTVALGSTQPLTEMGTRNISWGGKDGRCVGLTTLPPSSAECLQIWEPQPPGTLWACPGL